MIEKFIYGVFMIVGTVLSLPILAIEKLTGWDIIKKNDPFDRWSLGHVLASLIWYFVFYLDLKIDAPHSFYYAFGVMYLYELLLDATRIEDKEGFSVQDIGADFVGVLIGWIITVFYNTQ